jgi:Transglutaminase-like superfamily
MGTYLSQPLSVSCSSILELRAFLMQCRYVSDQEQFNKPDYWMPPEEFEQRKKGDCDDFALWTWRQLMAMGHRCRFVVGRAGRYGDGHAWVTLTEHETNFIVEPLSAWLGERFPCLAPCDTNHGFPSNGMGGRFIIIPMKSTPIILQYVKSSRSFGNGYVSGPENGRRSFTGKSSD